MENRIKLFLLLYAMTVGFFFTFASVWFCTGHELTHLSVAIITILSIVAESLYILWIIEMKTDGN